MRSVLLPLVLIWLALHAALLGLILAVKFLGANIAFLALVVMAVFWFLLRRRPLLLPPPPRVVV